MHLYTQQFGSVTLGRAYSSEELARLLEYPLLEEDSFIVKPNWTSPHPALDGRIVVRGLLVGAPGWQHEAYCGW